MISVTLGCCGWMQHSHNSIFPTLDPTEFLLNVSRTGGPSAGSIAFTPLPKTLGKMDGQLSKRHPSSLFGD